VKCPECGIETVAEAAYCPECGNALLNVCVACGKSIMEGDAEAAPIDDFWTCSSDCLREYQEASAGWSEEKISRVKQWQEQAIQNAMLQHKCPHCGSSAIIWRGEEKERGGGGCLLAPFEWPLIPLMLIFSSLRDNKITDRWYCSDCGNELISIGNGVYRLRRKVKTQSKAKDNNDSSST